MKKRTINIINSEITVDEIWKSIKPIMVKGSHGLRIEFKDVFTARYFAQRFKSSSASLGFTVSSSNKIITKVCRNQNSSFEGPFRVL